MNGIRIVPWVNRWYGICTGGRSSCTETCQLSCIDNPKCHCESPCLPSHLEYFSHWGSFPIVYSEHSYRSFERLFLGYSVGGPPSCLSNVEHRKQQRLLALTVSPSTVLALGMINESPYRQPTRISFCAFGAYLLCAGLAMCIDMEYSKRVFGTVLSYHFGKFGIPSIQVPDTLVSSVRHQYRYRALR